MSMFGRKEHSERSTAIAAFVVAAILSLLVGIAAVTFLWRTVVSPGPRPAPAAAPVSAPTSGRYRAEAANVLAPFLTQAAHMTSVDISSGDPAILDLVDKTQQRLLAMKVPSADKDAHLQFVLLLDMWKRALGGSSADAANVQTRTSQVLQQYPWAAPATSGAATQ